ncbi:MAG: type II toxin-antitoxin system VapC family toxin [Ilumatobacteraceae bacterium]
MTWYFDTSAFIKLVRKEEESTELDRWLTDQAICSSDLLRTEARRALSADVVGQVLLEGLLERIVLIRLTPEVFDQAGHLRVATPLCSLDAIHLATARQLGPDLEGVVTYDRRMTEAAHSLGVLVAAPRDR